MGKHCYTVMKLQKFNFFMVTYGNMFNLSTRIFAKSKRNSKILWHVNLRKNWEGGGGDGVKSRETIYLT